MAEMTASEKTKLLKVTMSSFSKYRDEVAINKPELAAAIDALDSWLNTNAATINNELPTEAKDNLTGSQKALVFSGVQIARYMVDGSNTLDMLVDLTSAMKTEVE